MAEVRDANHCCARGAASTTTSTVDPDTTLHNLAVANSFEAWNAEDQRHPHAAYNDVSLARRHYLRGHVDAPRTRQLPTP